MKENNIDTILESSYEKFKSMIDTDTVIGTPIKLSDGGIILPISKVSVGIIAGGGEIANNGAKKIESHPFTGGSGTGFQITPIGFLVGRGSNLKMLTIDSKTNFESILDLVKTTSQNFTKEK